MNATTSDASGEDNVDYTRKIKNKCSLCCIINRMTRQDRRDSVHRPDLILRA